MRLMFCMASLLIALAVVGLLVKKQLGAVATSKPFALGGQAVTTPALSRPALQSQQLQQQIKKSLEDAAQRPHTSDQE